MSPRPLPQLRLAAAAYRFRESLFALPALIVAAGVVLAEGAAYVDRAAVLTGWSVQMNSNGATWLLSTVAGAMITTAGVVFSLTVVSLQLASSQFSPRVMRSFIRDRVSQTVIGMLVATFVYCVLTLRHISGGPTDPAPRLSMTLALILTVATVVLIVAYLNRLAHGLQVGEVVRTIATEADEVIAAAVAAARRETPADAPPEQGGGGMVVEAGRDGWVTQAPAEHILAAVPESTVVRLETRPGPTFIAVKCWCASGPFPIGPTRSGADSRPRSTSPIHARCNKTWTSRCVNWSTSHFARSARRSTIPPPRPRLCYASAA